MAKNGSTDGDRRSPIGDSRLDRVLSAMIVAIIALSAVSMVLFMVGTAGKWLAGEIAAVVWMVAFVGLPIAIVLMVVVTIRIGIRRSRESKQ